MYLFVLFLSKQMHDTKATNFSLREFFNSVDATTNCRNLYDNSEKCDGWAKKGECGINPLWMTENCRKSCRLCHKLTTEQPPQKDDSGDNNDDEDTEEEEEDRSGRTASKMDISKCFMF